MGLDVRIRDSGQMRGRRSPHWEPYYLSLRLRGLSTTAAFVALGRKLVGLCFALLRNGTDFNPEIRLGCCQAT